MGFIVAFPNRNNDIFANGGKGRGENIGENYQNMYFFAKITSDLQKSFA
jgi:hypothetical protein